MKHFLKTFLATLVVLVAGAATAISFAATPVADEPAVTADPGTELQKPEDMAAYYERRMTKMRQLELEPLSDHDRQLYIIGDKVYARDRGEYKFQPFNPDNPFPENIPEMNRSNISPITKAKRSYKSLSPTADLLFFDDFELDFPDVTWSVWDDNPFGFEAYWDDVYCRAQSGEKSVWCSIGEYATPCEFYVYEIDATMTLAEALEITGYQDVTLSFYTWYEMATDEFFPDHMNVFYWGGSGWHWLDGFGGTSGGLWNYKSYNIDIDEFWTEFSIMFVFYSEEIATDEEGAYLDNVRIQGTPRPRPNLTYTQPPGWSSAITVSHTPDATSDDATLLSGQPAYINFGVINDGDAAADAFYTDVYVDDVNVGTGACPWLDPGETDIYFHNIEHTFTPGTHIVRIEIDEYDDINESDESDNCHSKSYDITVGGPDLTFVTPSGWSGPVVVTNDPDSRIQDAELASGRFVYLHFAVKNIGDMPVVGDFQNQVCVSWQQPFNVPTTGGLAPEEIFLAEAVPFMMNPGEQDVFINIDVPNDIDESNEENNAAMITCNVVQQNLIVRGRFEYQIPMFGGQYINWLWGKYLQVRLFDWDANEEEYDLLGTTYIDEDGIFEFYPVLNIDDDGTALDIVLRFYTRTQHVEGKWLISDDEEPTVVYWEKGPWIDVWDNVLDLGVEEGAPLGVTLDASPIFHVTCVLEDNWQTWYSMRPEDDIGTVVAVMRYPGDDRYDRNTGQILMLPLRPEGGASPGTIQRPIISRLFAERMEHRLNFFAFESDERHFMIPYVYSDQAAWAGFAEFWAAYESLLHDDYVMEPIYMEIRNNWTDTVKYNLETGEFRISWLQDNGTFNCLGNYNGPTAACILWDLYDDANDDQSGSQDWNNYNLPHIPDGIGDEISVDLNTLLYLMLDKNSDKPLFQPARSMLDLFAKWWQIPETDGVDAFQNVLYEHGIDVYSCDIPGDVDYIRFPSSMPDLLDICYLLNFLYKRGTPPPVINNADVNRSCHLNILDVTYLIAYIYMGGSAPLCGCLTELPMNDRSEGNDVIAEETAEVLVAYGNDASVFQLNSPIPLLGVEIQFSCSQTAAMQSLCAGVDLYGDETVDVRTVALVDAEGEHVIGSGFHNMAEVEGEIVLENIYGANADNEKVEMTFQQYLCGDANQDEVVNILDISFILAYLNSGGPEPAIPSAADPNGDCSVDTLDASYLVAFLYQSGPEPLPGCVPSGGGFPPFSSLGWEETDIAREPVTVRPKYENGITYVELNSGIDLLAIELEVICSKQATAGLNGEHCYTVRDDDRTRVALVAPAGSACVVANQTLVIEFAGEAEVVTAVAADMRGRSVQVSLNAPAIVLPATYVLYGNYPNPFNPATTIQFDLPAASQIKFEVFNVLGQSVAVLIDDVLQPGRHHVVWDGTDRNGKAVASGIYLYRLHTDVFTQTRKMVLAR